ncbi:MAG: hypothetical protein WC594_03085 [Thermodesulfovibrionales bacterium]
MEKKFMSISEIAALTGFSKQFFYGEIYKSRIFGSGIPTHRFGPKTIRLIPEEVICWLETRHQDFRTLKEAVELNKRKVGRVETQ